MRRLLVGVQHFPSVAMEIFVTLRFLARLCGIGTSNRSGSFSIRLEFPAALFAEHHGPPLYSSFGCAFRRFPIIGRKCRTSAEQAIDHLDRAGIRSLSKPFCIAYL